MNQNKKLPTPYVARELKVICLREQPLPETLRHCDTPEKVNEYFHSVIKQSPQYNSRVENFIVLLLNARKRVTGHFIVCQGTLSSIVVHPREVFHGAIVGNAAAVVLMHNHPSGDASPSEADIKVTRDLIRGGQLLQIEVLDHVIVTDFPQIKSSIRELGYFYS